MLNIFHSGGLFWGITLFWAALTGWFIYQSVKAHNSGWEQLTQDGHRYEGKEKIPYSKIPQVWFAVAATVLYIIALLVIASDYKGV